MDQAAATLLLSAARDGDIATVRRLVTEGHVDVNVTDQDGLSPLHMASQEGHLDVVKTLVEAGANIDQANKDGLSPLHTSCLKGHLDVVNTLIDAAANINQANKEGLSPLHTSCLEGHLDVTKTLIEAGANVNQANKDGRSPLFTSSLNGHLDIVKTLIEAKAIINQANKDGWTPLGAASEYGHVEIVKRLIKARANVNHTSEDGRSPLYTSCLNGHLDVVKTLIEAKANIDQANKDGWSPLYTSCLNGHLDVVKTLIKAGANIDQANKDGWTPLYTSCLKGHPDIVKTLIEAEANIDLANKNGETALDIAIEKGHIEIIEVLKKKTDHEVLMNQGVAYDYHDENQVAVSGSTSAGMDVMAQLKNDDSICVKVTWSKMQEDMQNADHRYEVVYSPEGGIENREQASGSECLLKNLKPDTIYTITVGILNKPIRSRSIKITTKQHFKYEDIYLHKSNKIDNGASGTVYRSKLHGKDVAAKVCEQCNESELKVLSMVRHENIVEFLGFAENCISSVYVLELADASLHDYVHDKTKPLDYNVITRWAKNIAKGVYYLHFEAMKPKHLVHCDLKPTNVLIFKDICKICDFGSMKDIRGTKTTTVYGTPRYRPPEYYTLSKQYKKKAYCASDVFSYGLTLWEMLKRECPHGNKQEHEIFQFYKHKEILAESDRWPQNLTSLYKHCCSYGIKERPTFKEILELLSSVSSGDSTVTPHSTDEDTSEEIPDLN